MFAEKILEQLVEEFLKEKIFPGDLKKNKKELLSLMKRAFTMGRSSAGGPVSWKNSKI